MMMMMMMTAVITLDRNIFIVFILAIGSWCKSVPAFSFDATLLKKEIEEKKKIK